MRAPVSGDGLQSGKNAADLDPLLGGQVLAQKRHDLGE
jgi:hypothetical protein